jgi:proline iminopeptidase
VTERFVTMDDGVRLRTWSSGTARTGMPPVVMVHGGPGLPDYLGPVADLITDLCLVHRYDQRGVGGSTWDGEHTIARQIRDLALLLDHVGADRAVLVGHSFGTDLVSFFVLAHPERVAGVVYLSGPFLGPWREPTRAVERSRRSDRQQSRLDELGALTSRSETDEVEFLALSWFTDHDDRDRAWAWAEDAARTRRPINYRMNTELNADKRVDPLEVQIDRLRKSLPPSTVTIGGEGDPRPATFLLALGTELGREVSIIAGAGHEPWLERPAEFRPVFRAAVRSTPLARGRGWRSQR